MTLQESYSQFLASSDPATLAADASLTYITTTTSFVGATEIVKHITGTRKHVKKTKEEILSAIEGRNGLGLAVEIDTTIEFIVSGGPYLPGLDDNFLADRTVHLPITHFVTFDSTGKILQIRQHWDQGSLLKQVDVIGRTGRNWPIRDSADQIKLIAKCVNGGAVTSGHSAGDLPARSRGSSTNAMRDPHASLNLFAPRADVDPEPEAIISPYAGKTRPHQRSFTDILGDEPEEDQSGSPGHGGNRPASPTKGFVAPKAGAGKNFQPARLFEGVEAEESDEPANQKSPERFYRPNPKKYEHFDFADGSDPQDAPVKGTPFEEVSRGKHNSQWDFKDFVTPQKPRARPKRSQDVRHWSAEKGEFEETPAAQKPAAPKPRRDAETHFELQDDGGPSGEPRPVGRPRGAGQNDGLGLYKNNLFNEDGNGSPGGPDTRALGNITNLKDRRRDFDAQFGITDEVPRQTDVSADKPKPVPEDRQKVVKMMEANWSAYDQSPISQKENNQPAGRNPKPGDDRGIVIAGDGMGGKKGTSRGWLYGEDDGEQEPRPTAGKKQGNTAKTSSFWDF